MSQLDLTQVRPLVTEARRLADQLTLSFEVRQELDAELTTIEAQLDSPRAKHGTIRSSLKVVGQVLTLASTSAAAEELLKMLGNIHF